MPKTVLIVEKDLGLMNAARVDLTGRGFEVTETTDGKGAPETVRREPPGVVVLAVDLDAGQNGYIICKKLKSDPDLKGVPVLIIGDPKGFESHQKLKTRADDYLGKPFDVATLTQRVGALIGFPEPAMAPADELFDPSSMIEEFPEELVVDQASSDEPTSDPDFGMVDTVFNEQGTATTDLSPPPMEDFEEEISISTSSGIEALEQTQVAIEATPLVRKSPSRPLAFVSSPSTSVDPAETRELRARVTELTGALEEARGFATELETRLRDVESQLEMRQTELETARTTTVKGDSRELFALKDAANRKDKEILRLKNELNVKEQEIVELRGKENTLEQAQSDAAADLARRDAQLKTLQARADQLTAERKRADQQLLAAREEGRGSAARLSTLQADFDAQHAHLGELEAQLEPLRQAEADAQAALAQAHAELDTFKAQLQDELSGLRQRLNDSLAASRKHEERASRQQARVRAQQEQVERLRATLQAALTSLDEQPAQVDELELDELAEA